LVLKQLDFLNAWQGKKPDLLWFSMFLTDQPLRALNRLSQKKLDHRVLALLNNEETLIRKTDNNVDNESLTPSKITN
ncbi:MAG TPA: hypothetical protein VJ936_02745, partial [Desulfobacteraceae bacterium]|nr:hypothetical protein [Desulfobacteraceae bacterium]